MRLALGTLFVLLTVAATLNVSSVLITADGNIGTVRAGLVRREKVHGAAVLATRVVRKVAGTHADWVAEWGICANKNSLGEKDGAVHGGYCSKHSVATPERCQKSCDEYADCLAASWISLPVSPHFHKFSVDQEYICKLMTGKPGGVSNCPEGFHSAEGKGETADRKMYYAQPHSQGHKAACVFKEAVTFDHQVGLCRNEAEAHGAWDQSTYGGNCLHTSVTQDSCKRACREWIWCWAAEWASLKGAEHAQCILYAEERSKPEACPSGFAGKPGGSGATARPRAYAGKQLEQYDDYETTCLVKKLARDATFLAESGVCRNEDESGVWNSAVWGASCEGPQESCLAACGGYSKCRAAGFLGDKKCRLYTDQRKRNGGPSDCPAGYTAQPGHGTALSWAKYSGKEYLNYGMSPTNVQAKCLIKGEVTFDAQPGGCRNHDSSGAWESHTYGGCCMKHAKRDQDSLNSCLRHCREYPFCRAVGVMTPAGGDSLLCGLFVEMRHKPSDCPSGYVAHGGGVGTPKDPKVYTGSKDVDDGTKTCYVKKFHQDADFVAEGGVCRTKAVPGGRHAHAYGAFCQMAGPSATVESCKQACGAYYECRAANWFNFHCQLFTDEPSGSRGPSNCPTDFTAHPGYGTAASWTKYYGIELGTYKLPHAMCLVKETVTFDVQIGPCRKDDASSAALEQDTHGAICQRAHLTSESCQRACRDYHFCRAAESLDAQTCRLYTRLESKPSDCPIGFKAQPKGLGTPKDQKAYKCFVKMPSRDAEERANKTEAETETKESVSNSMQTKEKKKLEETEEKQKETEKETEKVQKHVRALEEEAKELRDEEEGATLMKMFLIFVPVLLAGLFGTMNTLLSHRLSTAGQRQDAQAQVRTSEPIATQPDAAKEPIATQPDAAKEG